MAAEILSVLVILVCLWTAACSSYQETRSTQRILKSRRFEFVSNRASKNCRSDADCNDGEYCHAFHRLCLKHQEPVTVTPVKTSVKKCSKDSNCKSVEYCHDFWKICLPSQKVYREPTTIRPPGYCRTSKGCKVGEQCHKRFHVCYTRPGMPTVRRNANSRQCDKDSDCGRKFYCHDHFRICLEDSKPVTKLPKKTAKSCGPNTPCPKGKLCHDFWKICYTPAPNVTLPQVKSNKTQQCQIDSDCKPDEFCHTMATQSSTVVARQRRNTQGICLSRKLNQPLKNVGGTTCKTDADCGSNKCCLGNLGICMTYRLPGEMCLTAKTDFVCPCANGSYCKSRGKWASPRRIINKMKLPQTVASHIMNGNNKKKHNIGKCTPSSF